MQERAAELGGWCTVSNGSGGTVVCAEIPIGAAHENAGIRPAGPGGGVADDHPVYREGLAGLIDTEEGLEVVGRAGNGHEAIALVDSLEPDLLVLDLDMPELDGISALREISARAPGTAVLDPDDVWRRRRGVRGDEGRRPGLPREVGGSRQRAARSTDRGRRQGDAVRRTGRADVRLVHHAAAQARAAFPAPREREVLTLMTKAATTPPSRRSCRSAPRPCATWFRRSSPSSASRTDPRRWPTAREAGLG